MADQNDPVPFDPQRPEPPPLPPGSDPRTGAFRPPPGASEPPPPAAERVRPGHTPVNLQEKVSAENGRALPARKDEAAESSKGKKPPHEHRDGLREIVDTVVIVIVLVLLLKSFVAEAFVIPTGSMAPTLLGYHRPENCPQCGIPFRTNVSREVDAQESNPARIVGGTCSNCELQIDF